MHQCSFFIESGMSKVKNVLMAGALFSTLGASAFGASTAFAAEKTDAAGPFQGLVQAIATKFNLKTEDVQAVFEEQRATKFADLKANMEARLTERLAAAVKDGKLTEAQATLIKNKVIEITAAHEAVIKDNTLTKEERKTLMEKERADLKAWAEENDIPLGFLRPEFNEKMMGKGGHGFRGHMGQEREDQKD